MGSIDEHIEKIRQLNIPELQVLFEPLIQEIYRLRSEVEGLRSEVEELKGRLKKTAVTAVSLLPVTV
jgi:hypothetical protein